MVDLTGEQEAVAEAALRFVRLGGTNDGRRWFSYEGLAGVGKSCVLIELAKRLPKATLVALYGKAASNLSIKSGLPASTVHSILYHFKGEDIDEDGNRDLIFQRAVRDGSLRQRVILLDELSVVDEKVGSDLMRTGALVIAAGDPGQLPPVRGRRFFERPDGPDARLVTVHRQAWDSGIIRQAWAVRHGEGYRSDGPEMQVVETVTGDRIKAANTILCWKNVTRRRLIGLKRQWLGLPDGRLKAGEPVMCLLNNHELGIMNGQVVDLAQDYVPGESMWVSLSDGAVIEIDAWVEDFEGSGDVRTAQDILTTLDDSVTPFASGWVATVHKFIGSEADNVVVNDEFTRPENAREWRYTALTRAAKNCTVLRS
jgi:ATP-dependent exoDNAse (exonuclease V) alpha subunit